jgi:uncharacterized membrane protein
MSDAVNDSPRFDWSRRMLPVALVLSTCLNIGFASFIAVRIWSAESTPIIVQTPQALFGLLEARLPAEDAAIFKDIVREQEAELRAARSDQQHARLRVVAAVAQRDLDPGAFRSAMKELRDARSRTTAVTFDIIERTMERISPQTRLNLLAQYRLR